MILLPVAVLMCGYALMVFLWRGSQIARKQVRLRIVPCHSLCFVGGFCANVSCGHSASHKTWLC